MRAEDLSVGCCVLVNGVLRHVEAITKKKIGYHTKPCQSRMFYERLRNVKPVPISESISSAFNVVAAGKAFMFWDDRCLDCKHQYVIVYKGVEIQIRYVHEAQTVAKAFGFKFWFTDNSND